MSAALALMLAAREADRALAAAVDTSDGTEIPEQRQPWVAHTTLRYTDDPSVDEYADLTGPVVFDRVRVAFGGEVTDIPLSTTEGFRYRHGWILLHPSLSAEELARDYGDELDRHDFPDGSLVARSEGVLTVEVPDGDGHRVVANPSPTQARAWADHIEDNRSGDGLDVEQDGNRTVLRFVDDDDEGDDFDLSRQESDEFLDALRDLAYIVEDHQAIPADADEYAYEREMESVRVLEFRLGQARGPNGRWIDEVAGQLDLGDPDATARLHSDLRDVAVRGEREAERTRGLHAQIASHRRIHSDLSNGRPLTDDQRRALQSVAAQLPHTERELRDRTGRTLAYGSRGGVTWHLSTDHTGEPNYRLTFPDGTVRDFTFDAFDRLLARLTTRESHMSALQLLHVVERFDPGQLRAKAGTGIGGRWIKAALGLGADVADEPHSRGRVQTPHASVTIRLPRRKARMDDRIVGANGRIGHVQLVHQDGSLRVRWDDNGDIETVAKANAFDPTPQPRKTYLTDAGAERPPKADAPSGPARPSTPEEKLADHIAAGAVTGRDRQTALDMVRRAAGMKPEPRPRSREEIADMVGRGEVSVEDGTAMLAALPTSVPEVPGPSAREVEVDNAVRQAYRAVLDRRANKATNQWVMLSDLRAELGDSIGRPEVDAALVRMGRGDYDGPGSPSIIPESNQSALTQANREGAVHFGGQNKHAIRFDDPSPLPVPSSRPSAPPGAKLDREEIDKIVDSGLSDEGKRRILTGNGVPQSEWPAKKATSSVLDAAKREADAADAGDRQLGLYVSPRHPSLNTPTAAIAEMDRANNPDGADDALEGLSLTDLRRVAQGKGFTVTGNSAERVRAQIVEQMVASRPNWGPANAHNLDQAIDQLARTDWHRSDRGLIDMTPSLDGLSIREVKEVAARIGLPIDDQKTVAEWRGAIQGAFTNGTAKVSAPSVPTKATRPAKKALSTRTKAGRAALIAQVVDEELAGTEGLESLDGRFGLSGGSNREVLQAMRDRALAGEPDSFESALHILAALRTRLGSNSVDGPTFTKLDSPEQRKFRADKATANKVLERMADRIRAGRPGQSAALSSDGDATPFRFSRDGLTASLDHDLVADADGKVRAEGQIRDGSGAIVGSFGYHLDPVTHTVHLDSIGIAPEHQGKGFGASFNRHVEDSVREQGYTTATVDAAYGGGYAWARAGYGWDTDRAASLGDVPFHISQALSRDPNGPNAPLLRDWLGRLVADDSSRWPSPREIADSPVGREVMGGASWKGVKSLASRPSAQRDTPHSAPRPAKKATAKATPSKAVAKVAAAKATKAAKPAAPPFDAESLGARLRAASSREVGHDMLADLKKAQLVALAKSMSIPRATSLNLAQLRAAIVEASVGHRLDSAAIRGLTSVRY